MIRLFNLFRASSRLSGTTISNLTINHQPLILSRCNIHSSKKAIKPTKLTSEQMKLNSDKIPPTSKSFTKISEAIDKADKAFLERKITSIEEDPKNPWVCFKKAIEKANDPTRFSIY